MASNMRTRSQRTIYLITYSRADLDTCNTRQSFANVIINTWETVTPAKVVQWAVCREEHEESPENPHKFHYHMALKLDRRCRWSSVREFLEKHYNIKVNFSDNHVTYYSAYKYCTKEDSDVVLSPDHPNLENHDLPRTTEATKQRKVKATKRKASGKNKPSKKRRLSVYDVTRIIRENKIRTRLELVALASSQEKEGKSDLIEFIANRGYKIVEEAISVAQEFTQAEKELRRSKLSRIDLLQEQMSQSCVDGCGKIWLDCAKQLLQRHHIDITFYCNAIYSALKDGRGKYRNIYIYGPANCGKTFMLAPLKIIYRCFVNPATGTFAWMGAEKAEVILLNDFRWNASIVAWSDFLQMLEGDTTHLPAPKNFVRQDIVFDRDTPFFATADQPLLYIKSGIIDSINSEMMRCRWNHFNFTGQIPQHEQRAIIPCGHCFADLILSNKSIV